VFVNGQDYSLYFPTEALRSFIEQPLKITEAQGKFDIFAKLNGGGKVGQAGALRHGISRALVDANEEYKAERLPHPRPAHERTKEARSAGCPQAVPVLETLIRFQISLSCTPRPVFRSGRSFYFRSTFLHRMSLPLPKSFRAAGLHAGIKKDGIKDMALFVSDVPAQAAGVFTTNQVCAAPVHLDRERVANGRGRAILVNSGNANACTGPQGLEHARTMSRIAADALDLPLEDTFVCSTGSIGKQLPMDVIGSGIHALVAQLGTDGIDAADGILTSDSKRKVARRTFEGGASMIAVAKGAGMIQPNMATMLCFVLTDLQVDNPQAALRAATEQSFNRITVDGDMSTNDTVLLLANGASGVSIDPAAFQTALDQVLHDLALQIVNDGEGISKVVTLKVAGADSDADADTVARAVANSLLVKTAWAGTYPSWGRVMDAIGYAGVPITEEKIDIDFNDTRKVTGGLDTGADTTAITAQREFSISIDLGRGSGNAIIYTTDCTEAYVRFNMH